MKSTAISNYCRVLLKHWVLLLLLKWITLNAKMVNKNISANCYTFMQTIGMVNNYTVDYSMYYEISNLEDSLVT